jgi:hypothetical protein
VVKADYDAPAVPPLIGGLKVTVPDSFEGLFKGSPLGEFFEELGAHSLARNTKLFVQRLGLLDLFHVYILALALQHKVPQGQPESFV